MKFEKLLERWERSAEIADALEKAFDRTPAGIIRTLDLPWERTSAT
ncbi:MAG: hypothetical protein ACKOGH_04425 [Alphaproteobacteria bacterium]